MSRVTIRVRGIPALKRESAAFVKQLNQKTELALDVVSVATENTAKLNAPVGTPQSTGIRGYIGGTLRDSIDTYEEKLFRRVGTDLYYADWVHEGTSKMEGRPFLRRAFNRWHNELPAMIRV